MPITFTLEFESSQHGILEIGSPEGVDSAEFTIGKEDNSKLGRDLSFAGGEKTFRIYKNSSALNHDRAFELILYNWKVIGYNSVIKFSINFSDDINQIGELELGPTFETDDTTYVQFNIVQGGKVQLFKNRYETNVNLFATEDLDGNTITPVNTQKLLYKALPLIKRSKWIVPQGVVNRVSSVAGVGGTGTNIVKYFNFIDSTTEYDIEGTTSYLRGSGDKKQFVYIKSLNNLSNVSIDITSLNATLETNGSGYGSMSLYYYIGSDEGVQQIGSGTLLESISIYGAGIKPFTNTSFSIDVDYIPRTTNLYIWFSSLTRVANNSETFSTLCTINTGEVTISATSTSFSSVFDVVRLYDAMAYVAEYLGDNTIDAQRWGVGGEFYNVFITTSQLMRHLNDKPFNVDQKTITEKYLPQVFGGVQVNDEGLVYYGRYPDFYRNQEIGAFLVEPLDYKPTINPLYYCNLLEAKYENVQSNKENEKENTNDSSTDAQYAYPNIKGQNTKEVSIGVITDPPLIEVTRTKALSLKDNTATQDDDKIFLIDCVPNTSGLIPEDQTAFLQHTVEDGKLVLRNQSEFDWSILGIVPGSPFRILSGVNNFNTDYTVVSVVRNAITLQVGSGFTLVNNSGINTKFTFFAAADLINRTTEGFSLIEGLNSNDKTGNLRFTLTRLIRTYYNEFNATMCLNTSGNIKVTKYNNNPDLKTRIDAGLEYRAPLIIEGADFKPSSPILTQRIISTKITCSLKEWFDLGRNLKNYRGYVRLIDPNGLPVRVFIQTGKFNIETPGVYGDDVLYGSADIVGEEMYVNAVLEIMSIDGTVLINNEIMPSQHTWEVDQYGKLSIFDYTMKLLYPPTLFNQVSINGKQMISALEMVKSMSAITPK